MKKVKTILFLILIVCANCRPIDPLWDTILDIENKLTESTEIFDAERINKQSFPKSVKQNQIEMVSREDWTSGFFAGELWIMYDLTGDDYWKGKAIEYTIPLEQEKLNSCSELGLKMFCSYGKAYDLTSDAQYREVLIRSAQTLATLFKPNIGCIRSYLNDDRDWNFPVLIDNMMSLELLFWAAKETGNQMYWDIAFSHAETTLQNHFRSDCFAYQVVDYDFETGAIRKWGSIDKSSKVNETSKGQAVALYAFTVVYRETGDEQFLKQAEKIASYILKHLDLKDNLILYWDFNSPNIPNEPCDVSSAAIMASAFYELSTFSESKTIYQQMANSILEKLMGSEFLMSPMENHGFLLKQANVIKTPSETSKPSICADYYLVEAIARKWRIEGQSETKRNLKNKLSQINNNKFQLME